MKQSERIRELLNAHGKPFNEVYYDHENSGFVPREVVEAMLPYFNIVGYGHPSITHLKGWEALEAIYRVKERVAESINASNPEEIVFTHSGTEANNLAIAGVLLARRGTKGRVVVSAIEHLSVMNTVRFYADLLGFKHSFVVVDKEGFVDPNVLEAFVTKDTVLVSIQMVNHEIGTIQNVKELIDTAKSVNQDVLFHVDACDAFGWVPIDVEKMNIDLLTLSSHKIHGPRGVGVLYVREGLELEPPIRGQLSVEKLWPGVEFTPLIVGFGKAVEILHDGFEERVKYVKDLRDRLLKGILDNVPDVLINGPVGDKRVANNLNVSFLKVEGEALTVELSMRGIYVSSGSACTSRVLEPSHVLLAIGRRHEEAHGSVLFKLTRYHTVEDVDYTLNQLPQAVDRLRKISSIKD